MPQESLLPGTDAITKGQVENVPYRGKRLVRYRNLQGYTTQRQFENGDESDTFFWECVEKLKQELRERRERNGG